MTKQSETQEKVAREVRIKSFVPISPGYFAVFYDVRKKALAARVPVVGWAIYEREELHGDGQGPSTRVLRDTVEAMVLTNLGEAEFVSDYYPLDDGRESFRLLGIAIPGDTTDWSAEMEHDVEFMARTEHIRLRVADEESKARKSKANGPPPKRRRSGTKPAT